MNVFLSGDQQQAARQLQGRLVLLVWALLLIFAVIALRAFQLTVFPDEAYKPKENTAEGFLTPRRGDIVDRNGTLLATSLKVVSLFADPLLLDEDDKALEELVKIFPDLPVEKLKARLAKEGRFVWIKRHITPAEAAQVNALGIPGLEFMDEYQRVYPYEKTTAHIVGAVNVDGKGLEGTERNLDEALEDPDKQVRLAMDVRLQSILAEEIEKQIDHFKAIGGAGLIIDIPTGEVLAAVSLPSFDPNQPGKQGDRNRFNRLVSGVYEMGSSFKIFATAALLEQKDPPLSQTYDAREPLRRGKFTISDFHPEKRVMTIPEIFMHSSNIGTALMAEDVGTKGMQAFYRQLDFFDPLTTDLFTTARPLTPKPWNSLSTLTVAYGHGIAVTPLHLAGGVLKVLTPDKKTGLEFVLDDEKTNNSEGPVVSHETADTMKRLLRLVVRMGTGEKANTPGFLVGGKTATAEKTSGGGYSKSALLSSFVGIYPSDKPKTMVIVMIDEPKGQKDSFGYATAGWTAAPAVGNVISRITALRGELPRAADRGYDPSDPLMKYLPENIRLAIEQGNMKGVAVNDR